MQMNPSPRCGVVTVTAPVGARLDAMVRRALMSAEGAPPLPEAPAPGQVAPPRQPANTAQAGPAAPPPALAASARPFVGIDAAAIYARLNGREQAPRVSASAPQAARRRPLDAGEIYRRHNSPRTLGKKD